ncbi:MAG: amino acid adenylation domain-containing protein, partial [Tumebacillaceae bacterium]
QPKRDPSYPPIFQTMFVLQKSHLADDQGLTAFALSEDGATMQAGDLLLESMSLEQRAAQFDLTLSMAEVNGEIVASFEYNRDLFDGTTIERMSGHFQTLTAGLLANPNGLLADAPLLTPEERDLLLYGWNDTATDVMLDECLQQKFEQQVAKTPDLIAVVYGDEQVTYRELNERANRLAHHLRDLGIGPEVTVGICVDRSIEMIVGLLGILKSGGAYVPLDPVNPPERLRLILEDSQAPVLLTQKKLEHVVPSHTAQTVYLDAEEAFWQTDATDNPDLNTTADNLAYIIYTSGTTGKPKGVCVPHRGVLNLLYDTERRRELVVGDGCISFSSFGFDVSVYEMFGSLLFGGRLHPVPEVLRTDVPAFFRWLEASDIQIAYLPAFMLQDFVHWQRKGTSKLNLRRILVGVEPLSEPMLAEICRLQPNAIMVNGYGPTETSIFVTLYEVSGESTEVRNAPIGRPVDNMRTYVLDARMQPVPIGVPGELYIGGVAVVRGYLNRPDLTEEKFIPSPFADGERLYRTGDLVRYNTERQIEFIGRIDQQVKLRGFRIELGEIEFVLAGHPDVNDVVVLAREDQRGEKRLVAYVIPEAFAVETLTADMLRERLQAHLPPYMVPSAFVFLDVFPLNANGKIDARALPEPTYSRESSFVAPSTPVEELVAGIWADVMRLEQVGVQDDFFTLGGHSLLATQVISRINAAFGFEVPLAKLFEFPTVAGLAAFIEREQAGKSEASQAPQIVPVPRGAHMSLSFAQERMWFFEQFQAGTATYNMPGAVRLTGHLDVQALERSLKAIWRRHEALRTNVAVVDGKAVATLNDATELVLTVRDLRELNDASKTDREVEMLRLSQEEAQKPFDLTNDALVRTTLLQLGDEEHVLLLTMHHIVSDGWSIGVFINEMAALYAAFLQGDEAPELPALNVQYADFAHWQREWLQGDVLDAQLGYWKHQLRGELPVLQLPTDRPRPAVQTFNGASVPLELSATLTEALQQLSKREGVTLYMTLLSSFKTLLYRYSGQDDILVGSPIAGRNRAEIEHLIGFFVNTLVLRTDLSGDPSFRDLLGRVRQVALEAYAHQDLPFEKLVEEIQPTRSMTHSPLFQVMFALQNAPMSALELPGLTLNQLEADSGTAKFDLTLTLTETDRGLTGSLEYNTDLFDRATIERMAGHLQTMLEAIAVDASRTISALPLLTEFERTQLLVKWNETQAEYPTDACLHQMFEAHAVRTPDAVAVAFGDQQMTYGELNCRANQLAHRLQRMGVGVDVLVGICMERSVEMIVAVFGILKAGGAYVPLDATYPKERLAFMLSDAQTPVVLTQERLLDKLSTHQGDVICLEPGLSVLNGESEETPACETTPDYLAYVIYTSGTTG